MTKFPTVIFFVYLISGHSVQNHKTIELVYRTYNDIIQNHPLLRNRILEDNDYYLPCYRLALRIEKKVKEEIHRHKTSEKGEKLSTNLLEYIPLQKSSKVDKVVTANLRELIEMTQLSEGKEVWQYSTESANKLIQRYWYQVRNYHYAGDKKSSSSPSLTFLNWLCQFVGESGFIGFIEQEFAEKKVIRVLPIPFWRQDDTKAKRMEELLAFSFREMQSDYSEPVELLTLGEPSNSISKKLTRKEAREIGLNNFADVVIWGSIYEDDTAVLNCLIVHPVIGYYKEYWEMSFDLKDFNTTPSSIRSKIEATIFWCLAIQNFLDNDYYNCLNYFRKILRLELDVVEVVFRMGVVRDMIDHHEGSLYKYLMVLDRVGVEEASHWLRMLYGPSTENQGKTVAMDFNDVRKDFIKDNDLEIKDISKDGFKKLMYFEIVRLRLALSVRQKLPENVLERALGKAIRYAKRNYLESKYLPILGEGYFELALINHRKLGIKKDLDLSRLFSYYRNAALLSSKKEIHESCIDFFRKSGYLREMSREIHQTHTGNTEVLKLYSSSP